VRHQLKALNALNELIESHRRLTSRVDDMASDVRAISEQSAELARTTNSLRDGVAAVRAENEALRATVRGEFDKVTSDLTDTRTEVERNGTEIKFVDGKVVTLRGEVDGHVAVVEGLSVRLDETARVADEAMAEVRRVVGGGAESIAREAKESVGKLGGEVRDLQDEVGSLRENAKWGGGGVDKFGGLFLKGKDKS
jgi:chromosome segregation ATPase